MGGEEVSANENNQRDIRKTANLDIWCDSCDRRNSGDRRERFRTSLGMDDITVYRCSHVCHVCPNPILEAEGSLVKPQV